MKTYYKATQVDGTDFHSGTVLYEVGKSVKRLPRQDNYNLCSADVYHASDAPAETLVGGWWPCRLFEVTGRPVVEEEHILGFRSLKVLRELPAVEALGPNGTDTAQFITDVRSGAVVYTPAWNAARSAAWDRSAGWSAAWNAARSAAYYSARDAGWYAAYSAARSAARSAGGDYAGDVGWYAAGAYVVRDLISADDFRVLTSAWVVP